MLRYLPTVFLILILIAITNYSHAKTANVALNTGKIVVIRDTLHKPDVQISSNNVIDFSKPVTLPELVTIFASLATVFATILTYKLLRETQLTLKLSAKIAERDQKRVEAETVSTIYRNFRDTYMAMCSDEDGIKILTGVHGTNEDVKENMFSSFLINNVHEMYNLRMKGFIDDTLWSHFEMDICDFFEFPFIKKRWLQISKLYPTLFQDYINALLPPPLTDS